MDLKASAENVTMHGFGRMSASKSFLARSFWLILMLGFSSMCVYQLVIIISKYMSDSSVLKEETLIASELDFPAVTICGPAFSKWKLSKFATDRNVTVKPSNEYLESFGVDKQLYGFELLDGVILNAENLEKVALNEDEFLLKKLKTCSFNEQKCSYTIDFEKLLVLYRSYCYRFNQRGWFKQRRAGAHYGLNIILFLNVSDTTPWPFFDIGDAVEIIIQNPAEYPFCDSEAIFAKVGHLSRIDIGKTEIKRLKTPYPSNCTDGEHVRLIYPGKYTTFNCMESCIAATSIKNCNVAVFHTLAFLPNASGTRGLVSAKDQNCFNKAYQSVVDSEFKSCNCSLPCHETKFHKSASYSEWPATADLPFYKNILSKSLGLNASKLSDEYVRKNFMKISVFFGDMTYRKITEERKYTFDSLISNIGGQMGIWLGASMFSVVELLFISGQFFRAIFESKKKESKVETLESPAGKTDLVSNLNQLNVANPITS